MAALWAVEAAAEGSRAVAVHRWLVAVAWNSRLLAWFRRPPTPAVTVVDLGESRSVGWAVGTLDSPLRWVGARWATTRRKLEPDLTAPLFAGVRRSRVVAGFAALLTPPPEDGSSDPGA